MNTQTNNANDNVHNLNGKAGKTGKKRFTLFGNKENKQRNLGWWGATWRYVSITLLFVAAITAIVLGLHYGVAYIAGLAMSEALTIAATTLLSIVGYLIAMAVSTCAGMGLANVAADRARTKVAQNAAAAEAAAAA